MPVLVLGVPLALGLGQAAKALNLLARAEVVVRELAGVAFLAAGAYALWSALNGLLA